MKNILFLSTLESVPWGGSEQLWSDMALRLLDNEYMVMTNTIEWPELNARLLQIRQQGGRVTLRPNIHLPGGIKDKVLNKIKDQRWRKEVTDFKPDVIIINQGGAFDNAIIHLWNWIKSLNVPYYIIPNYCPEYGFLADNLRKLFADYYAAAEKIWFVSRRNMDVAERLLAKHITNGIVIKNPIRITTMPSIYPDEAIYKMASVARLETEVKGYDLLFEVLGAPQWKNRNYQLNIYGSGEHKMYLEELARFKGIENNVCFKGFTNQVEQIWAENHILVMPSRGEGTPLSLLEANFCERAAIVTDVGGNADVIIDGQNGFVAVAPVVTCFSDAMETAWENRHKWRDMGKNAKERLNNHHPKDAVGEVIKMII